VVGVRTLRVIASLGLVCVLGGLPSPAASEGRKARREKGAQGPVVDRNTGKHLNEALEHFNAERYSEARAVLVKLSKSRLSPYALSRVEQLLAAVDQVEGNYGGAREHLQKALASGGLNDEEALTARFQVARFYMAEERWDDGVEALKEWFATTSTPNSAAYHLLALAYYQLEDYEAALEPAQKAIDLAGGKPQESWLQLLVALRLKREEYGLVAPLLKQLIEASPEKKSYWLQLSAVDLTLGNYEDAAVPMQLAYRAGLLADEQDVMRLARILYQITAPYRAAQIVSEAIEKGRLKSDVESYEFLANCWIAAREYEKGIEPLRRAADLSDNGELYVRLAEVHVQREEWQDAAEAMRLALKKGKIKDLGRAQLLMGFVSLKQNKPSEARGWFQRASEDKALHAQAEAWLKHVESKLAPQS
jgi:tetratricopeptide (TPR) repeat protein